MKQNESIKKSFFFCNSNNPFFLLHDYFKCTLDYFKEGILIIIVNIMFKELNPYLIYSSNVRNQ